MAKKKGSVPKLKLTDVEKGLLLDLLQEKKSNAAIAHALGRSPITSRNMLELIKECVDHVLKADKPVAVVFSTTFTELGDYKSVVSTLSTEYNPVEIEERLVGSLAKLKDSGQVEVGEEVLITMCRNYSNNRPDLFMTQAKKGVAVMTQAASEVGDSIRKRPVKYSDCLRPVIRKPV